MKVRNKELGAIMLEAALGFLVLFGIVFTIIEFARYATMTAVLQTSADEALALAQTISGIDSTDQSKRDAGNAKISDLATRIASKTFFGSADNTPTVTLVIPTPTPGAGSDTEEQRRKALEKDPITIELSATVPTIMGEMFGSAFTVKARAIGFREPRNPFSEPEPLDCKGNPISPGSPTPTDCACPGAEGNPDVTYNPGISKCTCNTPSGDLTYTAGFPLSFLESGLEYDPNNGSCKCPAPWVSTDPGAGEPAGKCKCGRTPESCETAPYWGTSGPPMGAGAHVKTRFNGYNVCDCQPPCPKASDPGIWYGVADTDWDEANQRCECTRPADWQALCQQGYRDLHGGADYTGTFGMNYACACTTCGLGIAETAAHASTADYSWGCDCDSVATPCLDSTATRAPYYSCNCTCPGENPHVQLPDGTVKCAPSGCRPGAGTCYWDETAHEIKVCEAGGLCSNPLPYVFGG